MQKTLAVLKASALGALTLVLLATLVLELQISGSAVRLESKLNSTLAYVNGDIQKIGDAFDGVNNAVGLVNESLLAQPPDKLIHDARLSLDNINRAAIDERLYFEQTVPLLSQQAQGILKNVQTDTADLHPLILATQTQIAGLQAIELETQKNLADFDALERSPQITDTLASLSEASKSGAKTAVSVQHMAADGEAEVHSLTHPKPIVTIIDWTLKVAHALNPF